MALRTAGMASFTGGNDSGCPGLTVSSVASGVSVGAAGGSFGTRECIDAFI